VVPLIAVSAKSVSPIRVTSSTVEAWSPQSKHIGQSFPEES